MFVCIGWVLILTVKRSERQRKEGLYKLGVGPLTKLGGGQQVTVRPRYVVAIGATHSGSYLDL